MFGLTGRYESAPSQPATVVDSCAEGGPGVDDPFPKGRNELHQPREERGQHHDSRQPGPSITAEGVRRTPEGPGRIRRTETLRRAQGAGHGRASGAAGSGTLKL